MPLHDAIIETTYPKLVSDGTIRYEYHVPRAPARLTDSSIKRFHPELMNVGKPLANHERREDRVSGNISVDV